MAITPEDFRALRELKGLSLERLGERLHINKGTASRLERGKMGLDIDMASAWASACGARLVLIREGEELGALRQDEQELLLAHRQLTPDDQAVMRQVLELLPLLGLPDRRNLRRLLEGWRDDYLDRNEPPAFQLLAAEPAVTWGESKPK